MIRLVIEAVSDKGCVRQNNEDMVLVRGEFIRDGLFRAEYVDVDRVVVAVADGMGGHNGGEFASEWVARSLDEMVSGLDDKLSVHELAGCFDRWAAQIHALVTSRSEEVPELSGMGTTLVGILTYADRLFGFNVGDSRLYRFRDGVLKQLSRDHSLREMRRDNSLPSNIICNSIGGGKDVFIDFEELTEIVLDGDRLLLCSDGLSDLVNDDEISDILLDSGDAVALMEKAKAQGGHDNVSVVMICVICAENE